MSDWIAIDPHLASHPKFARLRLLLGSTEEETIVGLFRFWSASFRYTPSGDVSRTEDEALDALFGKVGAAKAMKKCGFIDKDGMIHDWFDYGGRLWAQRNNTNARVKRWKERQKEEVSNTEVTVTQPLPNTEVTRLELERELEEPLPPLPSQDATHPSKASPPFDDYWRIYPKKSEVRRARNIWSRLSVDHRESALVGAREVAKAVGSGRVDVQFVPGGAVFLNERWPEWDDGPPAHLLGRNGNGKGKSSTYHLLRDMYEEET